MGRFERSIKIAFDRISGEILEADEVFDNKKDAFEVRRQFHKDAVELYCCECEQKLNVSTSKYDRLHFKHQPKADYCILKDGDLTPEEIEQFNRILSAKESPRHKELKNKIAERLSKVEGIDPTSIFVDNRFIMLGNEKRRPDVYCKYQGKEIVFEIQLSDLSLRYILSRHDFYKEHGIYLIWILDNFDVHGQGQKERDIKYLTKYENFFKLDESVEDFKLSCKYKFPFLTDDNKLLTKWLDKSVSLSQVKFDADSSQVYYFNFGDNKVKTEEEQRKKAEQIREAERKRLAEVRLSNAEYRTGEIIKAVKQHRERKSQNFSIVGQAIDRLDEYELGVLNSKLNLQKAGKPALLKWISTASQDDVAFIAFILNCREIQIDINAKGEDGATAFQEIFRNTAIENERPLRGILKRGYKLTDEDKAYLNSLSQNNDKLKNSSLLFSFCEALTDKDLVDSVFTHQKLLFIIETARRKQIIGFNYKPSEWIAFANNAIQHHSEYWEYIELAFKNYGIWDMLTQSDKKGTFEKKVQEFYKKMPRQKFDFDRLFRDLFSDLSYSVRTSIF